MGKDIHSESYHGKRAVVGIFFPIRGAQRVKRSGQYRLAMTEIAYIGKPICSNSTIDHAGRTEHFNRLQKQDSPQTDKYYYQRMSSSQL